MIPTDLDSIRKWASDDNLGDVPYEVVVLLAEVDRLTREVEDRDHRITFAQQERDVARTQRDIHRGIHRGEGRLTRNHVKQLIAKATGAPEPEFDANAPAGVPASMWDELKTLIVDHRAEIGRLLDTVDTERARADENRGWAQRTEALLANARTQIEHLGNRLADPAGQPVIDAAADIVNEWSGCAGAHPSFEQMDRLATAVTAYLTVKKPADSGATDSDGLRAGMATLKTRVADLQVQVDVAVTETNRYRIALGASRAHINDLTDLLDQARTQRDEEKQRSSAMAETHALDRSALARLRKELTEYQQMAAAEADYQETEIKRQRRARRRWKRRANRMATARPVLDLAVELARQAEESTAPRTPLFEALLAAARDYVAKYPMYVNTGPHAVVTDWTSTGQAWVLEAAVAWRRLMPAELDPGIFGPQEIQLVATVDAWLTPTTTAETAPDDLADVAQVFANELTGNGYAVWQRQDGAVAVAAEHRAGAEWRQIHPTTTEPAHIGLANPYPQPAGPHITPEEFSAGGAPVDTTQPADMSVTWYPDGSASLTQPNLVARSCPTCHSIGVRRDDCRSPWHPENATCSQCGKPWTEPACGPTHAAIAAERNTYPTITSAADADTYLAGLFKDKPEPLPRREPGAELLLNPVPVDRVDPDGAADDDYTHHADA